MPALKQYQIFISHSWKYSEDYNALINLLDNAKYLNFLDYSVPVYNPLTANSANALQQALENQIKHANIVIILSGMYVNYSSAIPLEIHLAKKYNKPIIAVTPRGNVLTPSIVSSNVLAVVGWNTNSIVEAIRTYAL